MITNARILDGTGATIDRGSIVVRDGRLVSVSSEAPEAQASVQIDAHGMTVLPGLIETHTHLLLRDRSLETQQALDDWVDRELPQDLQSYLEAGFTTVLSTGDHAGPILRTKRRLEAGELTGPRLLVSGPVFTKPDAHPATTICGNFPRLCRDQFTFEVDDPELARARVRELAEAGVDAIKVAYEARPAAAGKLADGVLAAIAGETQRQGVLLVAHAPVAEDALRAVELGVQSLTHPPTRGDADGSDTAQRLRAAAIPFTTTTHGAAPIVDETGALHGHGGREYRPGAEAALNAQLARIRELWDRGVTVAFGTDRYLRDPAQVVAHEMEALDRVLSPEEIIATLTRNGATFLDLGEESGRWSRASWPTSSSWTGIRWRILTTCRTSRW